MYAELHARSAFSFLRGASLPDALVQQAAALELPTLAVFDRMGVYGAPRFHRAASDSGVRPIYGAEWTLEEGTILPVLVRIGRATITQAGSTASTLIRRGCRRWEVGQPE